MKCPKCEKEMAKSSEKHLLECTACEVRVATRGYKTPPGK